MKFKTSKFMLLMFVSAILFISVNIYTVKAAEVQPDYGIYWYGKGNVSQKFESGVPNKYYDPTKPTVIYVHGWQPTCQLLYNRETFNFLDELLRPVNGADDWIAKGWNVGTFYWDFFADEISVTDAEAKIWTPNGPQAMRWLDHNGVYHSYSTAKSMGELFYDNYVQAMKGYQGNEIRIAGHSLGNQMGTYLTKRVYDSADAGKIANNLKPTRLALLDPYFSNLGKYYLGGKWTGEVCRGYVSDLKSKGLAIEAYRSSVVSMGVLGDSNEQEFAMTSFANLMPLFRVDPVNQHNAAKSIYFRSFSAPAPVLYDRDILGFYHRISGSGPSAASSNADILKNMKSNCSFQLLTGAFTMDSKDNGYVKLDRNSIIPVVPIN